MKRNTLKVLTICALIAGSYSIANAFADPEEGSTRYKTAVCFGEDDNGNILIGARCRTADPNGPCDRQSECAY